MGIIKYIAIIISGIGIGYIVFSKEPEVIDNTKRYESKIDSLEILVLYLKDRIRVYETNVQKYKTDIDSIKKHQNKKRIYYEELDKRNINMADSLLRSAIHERADRFYSRFPEGN